ncbi:sigma-70 family RNA polymerase sigma factor [Clostridium sp. D2Q-11]|uniref:Sigma-70 family RNA polymerase sigma factor n=1 Tax=Anaeromonas frigoriresistens TaxID=2683708 RepID=A0A942Z970_9FIRM|nr:sigma-70 family RNA polymerase sigma factor [Anaeromonas frigoriresistens]MBS4539018.1 sigma-70 family RNA polymerase sigma factor [Anaeromonas frigoriresistens]
MEEDKELIEGILHENDISFEKLILKYRKPAIYFAQKILRDPYIAEDVVQESFADFYVYKERFNPKYSFKTYLFTIIRNKSVDYIKKNRITFEENIEISTEDTTEKAYLNKERRDIVLSKINELKRDYRLAIYLVEFEELSYKEIAQIMNKNIAQVKIIIYRARKKLQTLLKGEV